MNTQNLFMPVALAFFLLFVGVSIVALTLIAGILEVTRRRMIFEKSSIVFVLIGTFLMLASIFVFGIVFLRWA